MRLWSLHPSLLDSKGLVALWREALLAQHVILGRTKGYRFHPQLDRFRQTPQPARAIATYLWKVHEEATRRGYRFDSSKIAHRPVDICMTVTRGQLRHEMEHLRKKLALRDPARLQKLRKIVPHPIFTVVPGRVEPWERVAS